MSTGSTKKYYFDCKFCGHEYKRQINTVIKSKLCPYCINSILCSDSSCEMCFNNSFASHTLINAKWSKINKLTPREIFKAEKIKLHINKYKDVTNIFIGKVYETAEITKDHKYHAILISD